MIDALYAAMAVSLMAAALTLLVIVIATAIEVFRDLRG